ncbi:MAG: MBL fold metallo-hydrolase [Promethearchaeati archaeon]
MNSNRSFEISILFDNKCFKEGFLTGFGFSALIYNSYTQNYSLFDTGGDGRVLLHNLQQFDVETDIIKNVIISHSHFDHSGGLSHVVAQNPEVKIFIPKANLKSFQRKYPQQNIVGVSKPHEIETNMISSGQIGSSIKEQSLYLKKERDFFIIVGCTHPGLENFIMKARDMGKVKGVVGGFHGFRKYSYLEGIDIIGACHCTSHIEAIKKRFPNYYKKICVGDRILF